MQSHIYQTRGAVGPVIRQLSSTIRQRVGRAYRRMNGGSYPRLNQQTRHILAEAIFEVENDLEHRLPDHQQVTKLRGVRNALYDDLGLNE